MKTNIMKAKELIQKHLISLSLGILALGLFAWAFLEDHRHNWEPIFCPISALDSPVFAEFRADMDDDYLVSIHFDTRDHRDYWECAFGSSIAPKECQNAGQFVFVSWKIASDSGKDSEGISTGAQRGAYWGNGYSGSRVTNLSAENGRVYRIEVTLHGPVSRIESVSPYLKVEAPAGKRKDALVMGALFKLASTGLFVLAAVTFYGECMLYRKRSNWR